MDSSSMHFQGYGACYGSLFADEEVIHEARRKRQRIGPSPPHPRGLITPIPPGTIDIHIRGSGFPNDTSSQETSHSQRYPIQQSATFRSGSQRSSGNPTMDTTVRPPLQEAINELYNVMQKIKKLTQSGGVLERDKEYRREVNFSAIDQKVNELYDVLCKQFGNRERDKPRVRFETRSGPTTTMAGPSSQPRIDADGQFASSQEKRKRSRRVISLKRTYETMDVDMDP